ncbi:MAG: hypothetical protein R3F34_15575 [Planctomycetota bacterium]
MLTSSAALRVAVLVPVLSLPVALFAGSAAQQQGASPGMCRIEVSNGSKGGLVPNAEVYFVPDDQVKAWQLQQAGIDDLDWCTKAVILGRTARTDHNGKLELPIWEGGMLMLAHRDDRWFGRHFDGGPGPMELPLVDEIAFKVRLTDKAGNSITNGVVALRASDGIEEYDLAHSPMSALDNVASFFKIDDFQEEEGAAGYAISVAQVGTFRRIPHVSIDLMDPPSSPIVLEGLPTSTLELDIVDQAGKPVRGEVEVLVKAKRNPDELEIEPPPVRRITDTGKVTIPNVGLGLDLEIEIKRPDSVSANRFEVKGPMEPGKPATHKWDYREKDVLLMGVVVDRDGEPMADTNIDIYFETGNFLTKGKGEWTVKTRADGRIQYPLVCRGRDAIQNAKVRFVRQVEQTGKYMEYQWSTDEVTQAGIIDLGTIQLK